MKYIKYLLLLMLIGLQLPSFAQQKKQKKDNIVFLLRQKEHIIQGVRTIVSLKEPGTSNIKPGKAVIIVCGPVVKDLVSGALNDPLEQARAHGITVYACGLSLAKFGISKDQLPSSVQYTENGLIKVLELQKEGYLSVEL